LRDRPEGGRPLHDVMPSPWWLPDMSGYYLPQPGARLAGKKDLVIDDDLRNLFSLTSLLECYNMKVLSAENGRAGLEVLQKTPDIDVVLMDIMMPEMDGYDTINAIRQLPRLTALPIIAVTAKVMQGDREKCIEAGASDYLP